MNNQESIAEGERLIIPKRVEVAPRDPLLETLFIKLNQSKNEVSLKEVDVEDVDDTLIKNKLTCGKCHKTFNSRSSLIKHLKVKHHIVIVGVKHGRPDQGGRLAYYFRQQQKKADRNSVLRVDEKKFKKQIRKQISYEAVKAKKRAEWAMLESKDLLESLKVLWDTSDGVWKPEFAYVQYMEDVSPIYQYLITKLCLEDSYELRVTISLSILEMMFERFPGVFEQNFDKEIVLEALTPLKYNQGNDKEQDSVRMNFDFAKADCAEMKKSLEDRRNCKDINRARLDIMHKLCFMIQVQFGAYNFDFNIVKVRSGLFCSLFASASFDFQ
ncbi:hypothetical protein INT47_012137 [Mucor saturninus]|uniref:C2H2-type domain-containing protein n=1 Tax=Mucor saturninus TaxID=64648 RepID=A0A8H7QK50_9FUNG|nr:hypothetical protein INT47_012137 [Mucor saturninus]